MAKHDLPHAAPMAKHDLSNLFPQTFPLPEWLAALPTLRYSPNEIGALRERRLTHDARHASEHDQKARATHHHSNGRRPRHSVAVPPRAATELQR
jgi:hypothetical protein